MYICIGPHAWGRADTIKGAVAKAKQNRVKIYEGKAGWRHIVFRVEGDDEVYVDGMGYLVRQADATVTEVERKGKFPA